MALAFAFAEVANGLADLFRYDLRGNPRYYIFHVIDEIAVQILVVAETVAFSRANGLELVDMDIVPVGLARTGLHDADVQAWPGSDQFAETVARTMDGRGRIVLTKQRGASQ